MGFSNNSILTVPSCKQFLQHTLLDQAFLDDQLF